MSTQRGERRKPLKYNQIIQPGIIIHLLAIIKNKTDHRKNNNFKDGHPFIGYVPSIKSINKQPLEKK